MSSSKCCFLTCIQISQEAGQVVWYSQLLKNFPEFVVVHTVKGFGIVNKAEVDVFLELSWIKYRLGLSSFRINWWWWWRTGKPSVLQSVGLQRVGHNLATAQQQRHRIQATYHPRAPWDAAPGPALLGSPFSSHNGPAKAVVSSGTWGHDPDV